MFIHPQLQYIFIIDFMNSSPSHFRPRNIFLTKKKIQNGLCYRLIPFRAGPDFTLEAPTIGISQHGKASFASIFLDNLHVTSVRLRIFLPSLIVTSDPPEGLYIANIPPVLRQMLQPHTRGSPLQKYQIKEGRKARRIIAAPLFCLESYGGK